MVKIIFYIYAKLCVYFEYVLEAQNIFLYFKSFKSLISRDLRVYS